jgi:hypothetical protein
MCWHVPSGIQGNCKRAGAVPVGAHSSVLHGQCIIRTAPSASLFEWTQSFLGDEAIWIDKIYLAGSANGVVLHETTSVS